MRKKISRLAIVAAAAIAMIVPAAAPASASTDLCYVMVVIDTPPGVWVDGNGAKVEVGDYHHEQNCVHIDPAKASL